MAEETFDNWIPPIDTKLEKRPGMPAGIHEWLRRTDNEIKAFGLAYGKYHIPERLGGAQLVCSEA